MCVYAHACHVCVFFASVEARGPSPNSQNDAMGHPSCLGHVITSSEDPNSGPQACAVGPSSAVPSRQPLFFFYCVSEPLLHQLLSQITSELPLPLGNSDKQSCANLFDCVWGTCAEVQHLPKMLILVLMWGEVFHSVVTGLVYIPTTVCTSSRFSTSST